MDEVFTLNRLVGVFLFSEERASGGESMRVYVLLLISEVIWSFDFSTEMFSVLRLHRNKSGLISC